MTDAVVRPTAWFVGQGPVTRAHVALRWWTGPFGALEGLVPPGARTLDWGSGHGVLAIRLGAVDPRAVVTGVDIDPAKVASAAEAAAVAGVADRVGFDLVADGDVPHGSWDVVVLNDVLYLMAPERQERTVRAAARALAPDGRVICKEMAPRPRWKARLVAAQERVTVGVLGVSATGDGHCAFPHPDQVAAWLEAEGLTVRTIAIDRGYHSPHVALVGQR